MTEDTEQAPVTASRQGGRADEPAWPRVTRRGIQIALGLVWTMDGLLQFHARPARPARPGRPPPDSAGKAVSPAAKLCGFLLLLGVIFGTAYAAGAHLGPVTVGSPAPANGQPMRMGALGPAGLPSPLAGIVARESRR
jgi:hypothetical protein